MPTTGGVVAVGESGAGWRGRSCMFVWTLKDMIAVALLVLILLFFGAVALIERIRAWRSRK